MTGRIVIMGSGETAPTMVATHREAVAAAGAGEVVVLDSPFGFQENAADLTRRLVEFFRTSLSVRAEVASLRSRNESPVAAARFRERLAGARAVFAGPGSPSYALAVWRHHDVGPLLGDVVRRGGTVTLASAAALTAGIRTIPVYEIYKVGADPHWLDGLDLLSVFGVRAAVVPHWNNAEGGDHDTSRCYIGERRMTILRRELECGVIGVDEHTAASIGPDALRVSGKGSVTLLGETETVVGSGAVVPLEEVAGLVGGVELPPAATDPSVRPVFDEAMQRGDVDGVLAAMLAVEEQINDDSTLRQELRTMIVRLADAAAVGLVDPRTVVGGFVDLLLELRRDARASRRFEESDRIRQALGELGVEVRDTGEGSEWVLEPGDQNP
jgi:cyanophycinase-like exopeptidase